MELDNPLSADERIQAPERAADSMRRVRHYYGDYVRLLFVGIAVLVGLLVPFSGTIEFGVLFGGSAIVVLAFLAGFTNPHGRIVLVLDVIASALGVMITELFAVAAYSADNLYAFAVLEFISILFVIALYFSVKNVRASFLHQIGRIDRVGEFEE